MAKAWLWLLSIAAIALAQGCTSTGYYVTQSPPKTNLNAAGDVDYSESDTEVLGLKDSSSTILPVKILLIGKDIAMVIPPLVNPGSIQDSKQKFVFEMILTTHKTGVVLNTAGVVYKSVMGEEYRSKGLLTYQGGQSPLSRAQTYAPECLWPETANSQVIENNLELQADEDYCIAVWFEAPLPEFDQPFGLQIDGIYDNGKQTQVPALQYSPISGQFIQKP